MKACCHSDSREIPAADDGLKNSQGIILLLFLLSFSIYGRFKRHLIQENVNMAIERETESLLIAGQNNAIRTSHIKTRIDHHYHVMPLARISLTLSCHFSLSFIASGWSSGLHPVSSQSCSMYVRAGCPAFARPYVGVHRSTSLMSSSLLLQQCPACLVRLTWIVFVIGGRVAV